MALTQIDRDLYLRCINQEAGAWEDFVDRFIGLFLHAIRHTADARSVPLSDEDLDDLCSQVFLTLVQDDFRVLRRFRGRASLATYLTIIARRVTVHELKRVRKAREAGLTVRYGGDIPEPLMDESGENIRWQAEALRGLIAQLPSGEAELVKLHHLDGKSYTEIAEELAIPINSVGPTLSRARDRLRDMYRKSLSVN